MYYFLPDELVALLTTAFERNRMHHILFLAMLSHGLRVSDAISLESGDVQGTSIVVNKNRLKENTPQLQPLHFSENALFDERALAVHAGQIAENSVLKDKRLFPMCRQRVDQLIKYYGPLAGIPRIKCRSHGMRHSCGMLTWGESHSLSQVQRVLGHKNQSTSLVYLHESDRQKGLLSLHRGLEAVAQPRPAGCDFVHAPIGDKDCTYEKHVIVQKTGRNAAGEHFITTDDGKTWTPDPTGQEKPYVLVGWEKK